MSNNSYYNDAWRIINEKNQSLVSNYSMEFDGSGSDSITIPSYTIPENSTVSFWVKSSLTNPQDIIISGVAGHYYPYFLLSGGNIRLIIKAGSISNEIISDVAWVADTWFHIAITGENGQGAGSTATYYINGVSKGTSLHRAPTLTVIGDYVTASLAWNGQIDQVCFFDYALPATGTNSVATLYGGGTAVTNPMALSPAPVAYYQLGDQTASNNTTEPTPPVQSYLVPNNSLQDYVFASGGSLSGSIDLANPVPLGSNKTVSFWFKLSSSANFSFSPFTSIVNGGNCYYPHFINSSSTYNWYVSDSGCGGTGSVTVGSGGVVERNKWVHAAVVGDGSNVECYINGLLVAPIIPPKPDRNPTIQRLFTGMTQLIEFSNFSIFNTNLSATGTESISSLYNNGNPPDLTNYSNIIHWWKLNAQDTFDGTNWAVTDYIGGNTGTSVDMASANLVQSNLQHTSGYSPYALSFDGTNDVINCGNDSSLQITGAMTVSYWFKGQGGSGTIGGFGKLGNNGSRGFCLGMTSTGAITFLIAPTASSFVLTSYSHTPDTNWHHLVGVFNPSTSLELYFDGQLVDTTPTSTSSQYNASNNLQIGARGDSTGFFNGEMSNAAIWNTNLTSTEITEVYNQGVPSNLNTFSGTAPVSWWQLGSNSSFNINWDCLDEIGNNDGVSAGNMTEDDITNGVGYSANGLGTSSIEIVGDAPYSTANGISENMDVLDRVIDTPPTV